MEVSHFLSLYFLCLINNEDYQHLIGLTNIDKVDVDALRIIQFYSTFSRYRQMKVKICSSRGYFLEKKHFPDNIQLSRYKSSDQDC